MPSAPSRSAARDASDDDDDDDDDDDRFEDAVSDHGDDGRDDDALVGAATALAVGGEASASSDLVARVDASTPRGPDERPSMASLAADANDANDERRRQQQQPWRGLPRHRANAAAATAPPSPSTPARVRFPLHAAAYYGDVRALEAAMDAHVDAATNTDDDTAGVLKDRRSQRERGRMGTSVLSDVLDDCGNTILHVATTRGHLAVVDVVLARSDHFDVDARSSAGWTALQEAVHARDHAIARRLIVASDQRAKAALRAKKPELLRRVYVCFGRHRSPSDRVRVVHAIR